MTTTKDLRHTVHIKAKPSAVYGALMDSKKHTAFTGAPAKISRKVGGAFSAHGPHLKGINVDLSKNKRIVQAWRRGGRARWPCRRRDSFHFERCVPVSSSRVLSRAREDCEAASESQGRSSPTGRTLSVATCAKPAEDGTAESLKEGGATFGAGTSVGRQPGSRHGQELERERDPRHCLLPVSANARRRRARRG
jgi:uncharacterized protein YndB with AHSA1/START domain